MIHPWLEKYPIKKDSKSLIIGTHPPMPYCGKLEFYYGNMSEFWWFLDLVYPGHKLYENSCPKIEDIIISLEKSKLSITDIVYKTSVTKLSTDNDMVKINYDIFLNFNWRWNIFTTISPTHVTIMI